MPAPKGFRLNEELRKAFEEFCRANLLDERAVIEAWLLRLLEATEDERKAVAERYAHWTAERQRKAPRAASPKTR